jgi:hypothetical protein
MPVKPPKTLVKLVRNGTDNIVSGSRAIAYKCPILAHLQDRIDLEKLLFNDHKVT